MNLPFDAREQSTVETQVRRFYDRYWPSNLPSKEDLQETYSHLQKIMPDRRYARALDAGCGLGVCSMALSAMCERVVGVDHSLGSLRAAVTLAAEVSRQNIAVIQGSLMDIPCADETFDVILCWGVLMYVPSVERVFGELVRTLRPGGTLVVAVHRKTSLTPLHDGIRQLCLRIPAWAKGPVIKAAALPIKMAAAVLGKRAARNDLSLEAKIDDFYFIPFKRFFLLAELEDLFRSHGLSSEVIYAYTGRFKSSSSCIVRGMKG